MAIIGIGMDITMISRIEETIERYGERFLKRIYHEREIETANKRKKNAEYLAGCFAVKEATLKAIGDFPGRAISWADIYITHERTGKPLLNFAGNALQCIEEKLVTHSHVTITHDGDMALAQVILEKN